MWQKSWALRIIYLTLMISYHQQASEVCIQLAPGSWTEQQSLLSSYTDTKK